jgi:hypothetical protein
MAAVMGGEISFDDAVAAGSMARSMDSRQGSTQTMSSTGTSYTPQGSQGQIQTSAVAHTDNPWLEVYIPTSAVPYAFAPEEDSPNLAIQSNMSRYVFMPFLLTTAPPYVFSSSQTFNRQKPSANSIQ